MKTSTQWTFSVLMITMPCLGMDSPANSTDGTLPTQSYGSYEETPPTEPYSLGSLDFSQDSAPLLSQEGFHGSFTVTDSLSLSAAESSETDELAALLKEIGDQNETDLKEAVTVYMHRLASLITRLNPNLDDYELFTTNETLITVWNQYKNK